jgi:hypothetical protein
MHNKNNKVVFIYEQYFLSVANCVYSEPYSETIAWEIRKVAAGNILKNCETY